MENGEVKTMDKRKSIYLDDAIDVIDNYQLSIEYCKEHNIDRAIDVSTARLALEKLPSAKSEREILDELTDIMKEYYFTYRYEYDEAWENGFMKCMNLIPNVYSIYEKRKR